MKRPNSRIIGKEKSEDSQIKEIQRYLQQNHKRKHPNLKKEMDKHTRSLQNIKWIQTEKNFSNHIVIKTLNTQNKERTLEPDPSTKQPTDLSTGQLSGGIFSIVVSHIG